MAAHAAIIDHAAAIVDDAVIVCTPAGRIEFWSPGAEALFGASADEAVGRTVDSLAPADQPDALHAILRGATAGRAARRTEVVLCHRDGTRLTVLVGAAPLADADGTVRSLSLFVRDITDQRHLAAELAAAQARLADVERRMSQMTRLGALERITLDLAHELNQPLAAIGNYLRACQRLIASRQVPEVERIGIALDAAMRQSLQAGRIVGGVRAFVQGGETDKRIEPVAALVQEAVALSTPAIEEHGVDVSLDFDPAATSVLVDRVQILQVLVNLIRNAVEAMHDTPRRHLSITTLWQSGAVEITVADTGKGLPEALRDHLFEPFMTLKSGGTGLGLTICHLIVEAHGGRLSCRSAPGGGSMFCFSVIGLTEPPP